ncbi:MAG: hypothetical protein IPL27_03885 [Lewinellaceae bacterium]|nr:hypothetical protein [Lewinellaceae bacterium]
MDEMTLKKLWQSSTEQLELSLAIGKKNAAEITKIKVQTILFSMKPIKIFSILAGILWVGFVDVLMINLFQVANPFFLISAGIQVILTKLAIGIYLYQLILIHQVDMSGPILEIQEKLARLKSSTLWVARFLFLQLPVWTTFYWNESMLSSSNFLLYIIQGIVTLSFTVIAVWLFLNINYENRDKKWFRLIFNGTEWQPVIKSMELLHQIDHYKMNTRD